MNDLRENFFVLSGKLSRLRIKNVCGGDEEMSQNRNHRYVSRKLGKMLSILFY